MNKETFLQELKAHLQILEDQEQQDILEEYAQHIDMKIEKGLSESEAIQDFGPVKELAAGILEAYHVKPEYEEAKPKKKAPDFSKVTKEGRKVCGSVGGFFKEKLTALGRKIRDFGQWLIKPFHRGRGMDTMEEKEKGTLFPAMGRGVESAWNGFWNLIRWCLRLALNLFWLLVLIFTGIATLFCLFAFGTLVILLTQGYPMTGILVLCLGLILGGAALTAGCYSMLKGNHRFYKILLGMLSAGILVSGIGTGLTFGDFSSLTYGGEKTIGDTRMVTRDLDVEFEPGAHPWYVAGFFNNGKQMKMILDESVPENTVRFCASYNAEQVELSANLDEDTGEIYLYYSWAKNDEMALFMEAKDEFLKDLKAGCISSYRTKAIESAEVRINPANKDDVQGPW